MSEFTAITTYAGINYFGSADRTHGRIRLGSKSRVERNAFVADQLILRTAATRHTAS
jgi:hypothetical protein